MLLDLWWACVPVNIINWKYKLKMHFTHLTQPTSNVLRTLTLAYIWTKNCLTQSLCYNKVLNIACNLWATGSGKCWQQCTEHTSCSSSPLRGSLSSLPLPSFTSLGKDQNPKFEMWLLLNAYRFSSITKSKKS